MNITSKGITLIESMTTLINDRFEHLKGHSPDVENASCHIIYHESYQEFECELSIHHDKKNLFAKERGSEFRHAMLRAFSAMEHQLDKQKTQHSIKHENHDKNLRNMIEEQE
ncbi:HPF/RaiA family ribosome-associated protein [Vibrio sp. E150_011]